MASPTSAIHPQIQLVQSTENRFSPTQIMTINGKLHLVFISSKTTDGKTHYHRLDQNHWEKLIPCVQRVLLNSEAIHLKKHDYTNLTASNIQSVEIPLNDATAPIRYQRVNDDTFQALSTSEMDPLNGLSSVPTVTYHDVMKELRQTFINPKTISNPYLSTLDNATFTNRAEYLAKHAQEYPDKHVHIHHLHTSLEKDISKQTFDFYMNEILKDSTCKPYPITDAASFDLTTLEPNGKAFIPLIVAPDVLFGISIDPKNNQVFVYNASETVIDISKNVALQKILDHMKETYPRMNIVYSQPKPNKANPITPQPYRHLILFLNHLRSPHRDFSTLHQRIQKDLTIRSIELADKVQIAYNRHYERLAALGTR